MLGTPLSWGRGQEGRAGEQNSQVTDNRPAVGEDCGQEHSEKEKQRVQRPRDGKRVGTLRVRNSRSSRSPVGNTERVPRWGQGPSPSWITASAVKVGSSHLLPSPAGGHRVALLRRRERIGDQNGRGVCPQKASGLVGGLVCPSQGPPPLHVQIGRGQSTREAVGAVPEGDARSLVWSGCV